MRSLYWVRNDLRLHDNSTLNDFACRTNEGLAVWCPTPSFLRAGPWRRQFILRSLQEFKASVEALGGTFLIASKSAREVLPELIESNQVSAVFFSEEPSFEEHQEELEVENLNVHVFKHQTGSLLKREDLTMAVSSIPENFTKFRLQLEKKMLKVQQPLNAPLKLPGLGVFNALPETLDFDDLNPDYENSRIRGGEQAALRRLQSYLWDLDRLRIYKQTRNGMINWEDSSKFSSWLSVGALSPRTIYSEIRRYEQERVRNESTYWLIFELLWREFFRLMAEKWGRRLFIGMTGTQKVEWPEKKSLELFREWASGETDDDFINANMRELNQTGWMSNRGRQNAASYLCNTLGLDWRIGASYFETQLIDYDCSSNWGNWAYIAGVGQSERPRIFDPKQQASMYDSDSTYRRLWLGPPQSE